MKLARIFIAAVAILTAIFPVRSQSILLGVRDNQFAQIGYAQRGWSLMIEQSVFVSKFSNQSVNGYLQYQDKVSRWTYSCSAYAGMHYGNMYKSCGCICELGFPLLSWLDINGGVRPHYDTDYGYETAFMGGIRLKLHQDIRATLEYTNYPEYRLCEDRVNAGFVFTVHNLQAKPEISIPVNGNREYIRFLVSLKYELELKRHQKQ